MRAYWVAYLAGRVTHLDVMVAELAYMDAYCEWNQWPYSEWPHRRAPETEAQG